MGHFQKLSGFFYFYILLWFQRTKSVVAAKLVNIVSGTTIEYVWFFNVREMGKERSWFLGKVGYRHVVLIILRFNIFNFSFFFFYISTQKREKKKFKLITFALWDMVFNRLIYHLRTNFSLINTRKTTTKNRQTNNKNQTIQNQIQAI
jgi:hypothetical protein